MSTMGQPFFGVFDEDCPSGSVDGPYGDIFIANSAEKTVPDGRR